MLELEKVELGVTYAMIRSWDPPEAAVVTFVTIEAENAYDPLLPVARGIEAFVVVLATLKRLLVYVALIFET
jgi:hypothetical protein